MLNWLKMWLLAQLTQITAYIAVVFMFLAIFAPREYIFIIALLLLLTDDDWAMKAMKKIAPELTKKIEEWSK